MVELHLYCSLLVSLGVYFFGNVRQENGQLSQIFKALPPPPNRYLKILGIRRFGDCHHTCHQIRTFVNDSSPCYLMVIAMLLVSFELDPHLELGKRSQIYNLWSMHNPSIRTQRYLTSYNLWLIKYSVVKVIREIFEEPRSIITISMQYKHWQLKEMTNELYAWLSNSAFFPRLWTIKVLNFLLRFGITSESSIFFGPLLE